MLQHTPDARLLASILATARLIPSWPDRIGTILAALAIEISRKPDPRERRDMIAEIQARLFAVVEYAQQGADTGAPLDFAYPRNRNPGDKSP